MNRCLLFAALVLTPAAFSQRFPKIGYPNHEEYCRENPKMPTCIEGPRFNIKDWAMPPVGIPNLPKAGVRTRSGTAPRQQGAAGRPQQETRDWRIPMSAVPLPAGQAQARLPHANAGVLLSVRPKALLGSKWLGNLVFGPEGAPALATQGAALPDEMRLAVAPGTAGQMRMLMLVSAPPAVLVNVGDALRKKGVTACFVDVNTLLAGEYRDVSAAVQRMLGPQGAQTGPSPLSGSEEMAQAADVWLTVHREFAEEMLRSRGSSAILPAGISGITLTMRLRESLDLDALIHTTNAAVADKLLADAHRDLPNAVALAHGGSAPPEFLKKLKAAKTRHGVMMGLSIELSEIPAPLVEQLRSALAPIRGVLPDAGTEQKKKPTIHNL